MSVRTIGACDVGKGWSDTGYFTIVSNYVLEDLTITSHARFLYTLLVRYGRWKKNGKCRVLVTWVGRAKLAELMGDGKSVSEWSISQWLKELKDKGLIERKKRPGGSSLTYICNPADVYTKNSPELPGVTEDAESQEEGEISPILAVPAVDGRSGSHRREPQLTSEIANTAGSIENSPANPKNSFSDKDVDVDKDIAILSDKAANGAADSRGPERVSTTTGEDSRPEVVQKVSPVEDSIDEDKSEPIGFLSHKLDSRLTTRAGPKIGAPSEALGVDANDPTTAKAVWLEFHRIAGSTISGYNVPDAPTMRELANCKLFLNEYSPSDIVKYFNMVITRWSVIMEKWPKIAKTPVPNFYTAFTLRRELVPIAQSGQGLTSRTHRFDPAAAVPKLGWGDE